MEKNVTEDKIDQVNLYYNELYNMIHEEPPEEKEIKYYFIKNNRCQVTKNAYSYQIKINDQIKIELYFNNRIIKFIDKKSTNLIHIYNYSQLKTIPPNIYYEQYLAHMTVIAIFSQYQNQI